jgi:hypothetical protein
VSSSSLQDRGITQISSRTLQLLSFANAASACTARVAAASALAWDRVGNARQAVLAVVGVAAQLVQLSMGAEVPGGTSAVVANSTQCGLNRDGSRRSSSHPAFLYDETQLSASQQQADMSLQEQL